MTYTAEMAKENRQMLARAKELLGEGASQSQIETKLQDLFSGISPERIRHWVGKAQREAYGQAVRERRGGVREPGPGKKLGRPPGEVKRERHSPILAPGTKEIAQAIAKDQGWPGWGHAVDQAIAELAIKLNLDISL